MVEEYINNSAENITGDKEHDGYVLMSLMSKLNIDPMDEWAYTYLNKRLLEELDILIDDLHEDEEYFTKQSSELINNIGILLTSIFDISNVGGDMEPMVGKTFYIN